MPPVVSHGSPWENANVGPVLSLLSPGSHHSQLQISPELIARLERLERLERMLPLVEQFMGASCLISSTLLSISKYINSICKYGSHGSSRGPSMAPYAPHQAPSFRAELPSVPEESTSLPSLPGVRGVASLGARAPRRWRLEPGGVSSRLPGISARPR